LRNVRHALGQGGPPGLALLQGYLAVVDDDDRLAKLAENRQVQALESVSEHGWHLGFYSGFAGVAWASQHLDELLKSEEMLGMSAELDDIVAQRVRQSPWQEPYDLIFGLVGLGLYALDHPDQNFAADVVPQIINRLAELAQELDGGLTWWTRPGLTENREYYPQGYYHMGVAHGIPGVIALLGRACAAGIAPDTAQRLLAGAMRWLFANRRSAGTGSIFSCLSPRCPDHKGRRSPSARSAWCYGDPGIAGILFSTARAIGDRELEKRALDIVRHDCARPMTETGVVDATLCHGSAGLGHIYNRLYQATGDKALAHAARKWFELTLTMCPPGSVSREWESETDLLEGMTGTALSLLAACSAVEPRWDRAMLLSSV